jgi:hypothetical protein
MVERRERDLSHFLLHMETRCDIRAFECVAGGVIFGSGSDVYGMSSQRADMM